MPDDSYKALEDRVDQLIDLCARVLRENAALRAREEDWVQERAKLVERNEHARNKVEAMITRLKSLDAENSSS